MRDFRKYEVWMRGISLSKLIYQYTAGFPKSETFGLTSQMRRAVVSIPSNIAEGASRSSENEFIHFLEIAQGSAFELETQLLIAFELELLSEEDYKNIYCQIQDIERLLNLFMSKIKKTKQKPA